LTGGGEDDLFLFTAGDRRDVITDWEDGHDMIGVDIGADAFTDLTIVQRNDDTMIRFADVRIRVEDADASLFSASDFIF
ncbi:MAG: calcium-binding protein, partial [Pseudomonadota bacterium]